MPYLGPEGVGGYRRKCAEVAEKGYEGFVFTSAGQGFMGPPRWANRLGSKLSPGLEDRLTLMALSNQTALLRPPTKEGAEIPSARGGAGQNDPQKTDS